MKNIMKQFLLISILLAPSVVCADDYYPNAFSNNLLGKATKEKYTCDKDWFDKQHKTSSDSYQLCTTGSDYDQNLPNSTWEVEFSQSTIKGAAKCTNLYTESQQEYGKKPTTFTVVHNNDTVNNADYGNSCWCSISNYKPLSPQSEQTFNNSNWVLTSVYRDNENCAAECAFSCSHDMFFTNVSEGARDKILESVNLNDNSIPDNIVATGDNSDEASSQELKEKSENVNELREKEQSLANRLTSGVSMGAAGIGGMMLAQSISEQNADKDAEQDMAAYLATFRCEYAGGKSVPGGTNDVQLPADKLFDLYQEYVTLAADVKEAKSQLGLKPGIESEVVLDKANIGLYDDTSTGKTNGTYASVARALTDTNSVDAQKWNDQKAQTDKNLKIGIGVGVGGAAVGAIGNILTNHVDWDKIKDKVNNSKENKDKIKMLKDGLTSVGLQNVDKLDFSKLDLTEFDVNSIDFTKIKLDNEKDATKILNTTNAASWKSSFSKLYPNE